MQINSISYCLKRKKDNYLVFLSWKCTSTFWLQTLPDFLNSVLFPKITVIRFWGGSPWLMDRILAWHKRNLCAFTFFFFPLSIKGGFLLSWPYILTLNKRLVFICKHTTHVQILMSLLDLICIKLLNLFSYPSNREDIWTYSPGQLERLKDLIIENHLVWYLNNSKNSCIS